MRSNTINLACDDCGNHSLSQRPDRLYQCDLCGALMGDDDAIKRQELIKAARAEGFDAEVYELVLVIRALKGVRVERASGGDAYTRIPPFVRFMIRDNRLTHLNNIALSIKLSSHVLNHHWTVTMGLEAELYFDLAPKVDAAYLDESTIEALQADLVTLARVLERDRLLGWWRD